MMDFIRLVWDFYARIFDKLNGIIIDFGDGSSLSTSLGSILFSAIVIGFVVSMFWKGAKAQ